MLFQRFFLLVVSTGIYAAQISINADQIKPVSKDTVQAMGHGSIKMGATETSADKAKIVTEKHKVTIYTDSFVAVAKKSCIGRNTNNRGLWGMVYVGV